MKNDIFWDVTACGPVEMRRRFGETHSSSLLAVIFLEVALHVL
jgi:hypothetical protein